MIKNLVVRTIQKSRTAFQLCACMGAAQSEHTYIPRGLLRKTAEDYHISTNLKIADCYDLVKSRTLFQKAMEKDGMEFAALDIVKIGEALSAENVVGRSRTLATLEDSYRRGGIFIVATGGSSVGKSKILNNVGKQTRLKVKDAVPLSDQSSGYTLIMDGRIIDDKLLHTSLFHELVRQDKELDMPLDLRICLHDAKGKKAPMALANLLNFITASKKESIKMIIIDEADRFFLTPAAKENLRVGNATFKWKAQRRRIVQILQTIQSFCKHPGDISVVLCTSDSTFPIALAALGFTGTFNQWMVIAEPSPAETIETLRAWGVGENLALALVDVYGGHLQQIYHQLADMTLWHDQPGYWDCAVGFGFADNDAHAEDPRGDRLCGDAPTVAIVCPTDLPLCECPVQHLLVVQ